MILNELSADCAITVDTIEGMPGPAWRREVRRGLRDAIHAKAVLPDGIKLKIRLDEVRGNVVLFRTTVKVHMGLQRFVKYAVLKPPLRRLIAARP